MRIIFTVVIALFTFPIDFFGAFALVLAGFWDATLLIGVLVIPALIPLLWLRRKAFRYYLIGYIALVLAFLLLIFAQIGIWMYDEMTTIDTAPAIAVSEYLPFDENSKIVKTDAKLLSFRAMSADKLPIIDGAAAVFPVYSAFVHAIYPETTRLYDDVFEYNNTTGGYRELALRNTDIFIGAAPSDKQVEFAREQGTTFEYTQIGSEAFVFFVNKDNPIESLTTEQIKGIYSGNITNWSEVGGKDEEIVPFQRNEGSGSQSMLKRFMGDTPIIEPNKVTRSGGMGDIIEVVADYRNRSSSIGFSFRFYVEGIIKNPDIKMIAIDGVAPTAENIKNGTYPIITPLYAVSYKNNPNENVKALLDWMLTEEGQYIIEQTGYVGIE